jgi:hypothetical protein
MADSNYNLSTQEKTHYTNLWCRTIGIKSRDLDNHPTIDDCILLIRCRDTSWQLMNASEKGVWAAFWNRTYHNQYPLKQTHLNKLSNIFENVMHRENKLETQRNHIKAIRESTHQKGSVHMTANPLPATGSLIRI